MRPARPVSILLLALIAGCTRPSPPAAATYEAGGARHRIEPEELESWRRFKRLDAQEGSTREAHEQLALVKTLAGEAVAAGIDAAPATRLLLEHAADERLERALKNHVAREITVTEEAIRERYEARKGRFHRARSSRIMNLFRRLDAGASEESRAAARQLLQELRERALAGEDFGELAREHSDSQTRFRGGVIGFVVPGQLPPDVEPVVLAMAPGEISDVLTVPDGLAIFRCDAVEEAVDVSLDEARPELERTLRAAEQDRRWAARTEGWRREAAARIDWDVVESHDATGEATVMTSTAGDVTKAELELLMPGGSTEWERPEVESALERRLLVRTAATEARKLGLDREPEVANALHWQKLSLLATERMRALVDEGFDAPAPQDVQQYWESHRGAFVRPARYDLSAIKLPVDRSRPRKSHAEGHRLAAQVASGSLTFEEAARRHSVHPSAPSGGRIGWIGGPKLASLPNVLRTAEELSPGEVSRPVEQDGALWIVRLEAREPRREMTFEEARARAEKKLGNERVRKLQETIERERIEGLHLAVAAEPSPGAR